MRLRRALNVGICTAFLVISVLLAFFKFDISYKRFGEGCVDLWYSGKYFFCELFEIDNDSDVTVTKESELWQNKEPTEPTDSPGEPVLPPTYEDFEEESIEYFELFFNKENFLLWLKSLGETAKVIARILVILIPLIMMLYILLQRMYFSVNTKHNKDTKPLRIFKLCTKYTYLPIKSYIIQFVEFIRKYSFIWKVCFTIWIFNLNFATVIAEFLAFYFYFALSFDFVGIYTQIVKLVRDLSVFFTTFPIPVLIIFAYPLFDAWRRKIAKRKLLHLEARNCGFINELPIVSMSCGSMGKKKTTLISDMTLSQEVMFRQKALEILQKMDMRFPYFPWIAFEDELLKCIEYGCVYNLATVKEWVKGLGQRFEDEADEYNLYGYDYVRHGLVFSDKLTERDIFSVMSTYAEAYFIYVMETSLIVSNYSIRTDNIFMSEGNLPMWDYSFFRKNFYGGRHSHILDFDILRLGKKVIENNKNAGSFEFGVVTITEIGKERGNNLELKETKKGSDVTNQKNDLFNSWLKMCRHSATVDNFPFIKVFCDEQRPESWGADARDLADIITIVSSGDQVLAMPFYTIEEMLYEWLFGKFMGLYTEMRYLRGDNTLLMYLLKGITGFFFKRNMQIYNSYGYCKMHLEKERGTMDGKPEKKKYFLMNKKIYSGRFSTDCFSDYFNDMAKKTSVGLSDYLEYATEKASVEELKEQNSYFINSIYK